MLVLRCCSKASLAQILNQAEKEGGLLLLRPGAAKTLKELEAAFKMAERAFEEKANISSKLSNEAILFLACETNFSSAIKKVGADCAGDFVIVSKKEKSIGRICKAFAIEKAEKLCLPKLGKKVGKYYEAEMKIEQMALSRAR